MRISVNEDQLFELEEVYNPIVLKADKEEFSIAMRDSGFEIEYGNQNLAFKDGKCWHLKDGKWYVLFYTKKY